MNFNNVFNGFQWFSRDSRGDVRVRHSTEMKLKYPLGLAPSGTFTYLEKREEFNVMSVFKSPMAIVGALFQLLWSVETSKIHENSVKNL